MSNARELAELGGSYGTGGFVGMKNRIINGAMQVNQRGGTISATGTANTYGVDRFAMRTTSGSVVASMQQSTVAPAGFYNSLLCTVTTADASLASDDLTALHQKVEGVNVADLGWGAAGAQAVTLSFWVRSNLTGTYGVGIQNNDGNRSYPSTYTISVADTWEYKTITIPGDTSGTWNLGTTSTALYLFFSLSAGSNSTGGTTNAWNAADRRGASGQVNWGATLSNTFYITGVQLEKGSTATSFDYRPYGTELALCQRYYWKVSGSNNMFGWGWSKTTTTANSNIQFPVAMRTAPTALEQSGTAGDYGVAYLGTSVACSTVPTFLGASTFACTVNATTSAVLTAGQGMTLYAINSAAYLGWSAEL